MPPPLDIIWFKRASNRFDSIVQYLEDEWGQKSAYDFIDKVNKTLILLTFKPKLGKVEVPHRNIRGIRITKHIRLFYRSDEENITIIQLFDNRQNPKKRPR